MNRGRGQQAWRRLQLGEVARQRGRAGNGLPAAIMEAPKPRAYAKGRLKDRAMNGIERAYAAELERRRVAGEIQWWAFEVFKIRLADNTHYKPDFCVMGVGSEIEFHEAKGRKGDSYFIHDDDAKNKLKIAAEHLPFRFLIVWPGRDRRWQHEVIG